jgi:hypothetical protein
VKVSYRERCGTGETTPDVPTRNLGVISYQVFASPVDLTHAAHTDSRQDLVGTKHAANQLLPLDLVSESRHGTTVTTAPDWVLCFHFSSTEVS